MPPKRSSLIRKLALIPAVLGVAVLLATTLAGASPRAPEPPGEQLLSEVALTTPQEPATTGFAEALEVDEGTQLVGVKWNGSEDPEFSIEVQEADGSWSAPYPAEPVDGGGPDEGTAEATAAANRVPTEYATEAISIDGYENVRVRMGEGLATDVELVTIGGNEAPEVTGEPVPPPTTTEAPATTAAPSSTTTTSPGPPASEPPPPPSDPPVQPTGPEATQSSVLTGTGIAFLALAALAWVVLRPGDRPRVRRRGTFVVILMLMAIAVSACTGGTKGPATSPPPWPGVFARSHWGAPNEPSSCIEYAPSVRYAVVHHTGGGPGDNSYSDARAKIRGIWQYHTQALGWCDIGYNFLVDKFGTLWEGRAGGMDQAVIGAHAAPFNTEGTGVAILGDFTSQNASVAAQDALIRLLAWKLSIHHVDPYTAVSKNGVLISPISAHREVNQTACPGNSFYPEMGKVRAEVGRRVFYGNPVGSLDSATRSGNEITVAGWALDPDTSGPIDVHVYIGSQGYARTANNVTRNDVAWVFPGYGAQHGYQYTFPAPSGATGVCVYGINVSHGGNVVLGCLNA